MHEAVLCVTVVCSFSHSRAHCQGCKLGTKETTFATLMAIAPGATLGLSPCARPLHISHKLRSQGPGTLELDQIAPNYALRQMMEEWITGHESHSVA